MMDHEKAAAACRTYIHNFGNIYLVEADIKKMDKQTIPKFNKKTFNCLRRNEELS